MFAFQSYRQPSDHLLAYKKKDALERASFAEITPAKKSRNQEDLSRIRVSDLGARGITLHVHFSRIRGVRTGHTSGLTRHFGRGREILRLGCRRCGSWIGHVRSVWLTRSTLRLALFFLGHVTYRWRSRRRSSSIAVAITLASCSLVGARSAGNQRHWQCHRCQEKKVTDHRGLG